MVAFPLPHISCNPVHKMRRASRIDLTVVLAIMVCCAFLPLHLIGGGATILLCVSVACMAIILVLTVIKRRWTQPSRQVSVISPSLKAPCEVKIFQSIDQVDDHLCWDNTTDPPAHNSHEVCVICINSTSGGEQKYSLCCHNVFHRECMRAFIFHNQKTDVACPICRTTIHTEVGNIV